MIYLIALLISFALGILTLRLVLKDRSFPELNLFLGCALGLGLVGQSIFYIQLLGNSFNHFLPVIIALILLGILLWKNGTRNLFSEKWNKTSVLSLGILLVLAIPLFLEANFFHNGGWDAWSCWNLKAKFIYFGEENWKDMFSPLLWRSNTGYPLALPTINVWFWQWTGFSTAIPMFNAIILTLLTAGILLLGLQVLKVSTVHSALITGAVFTLAFGNTLCISQYSDILFSLYLLCSFICYLLYINLKNHRWLILMSIFIGLLSFTKNEGLAASGILTFLVLIERPLKIWVFLGVLLLASLPTIIFTLSMAPHSEAFVNGLISSDKPSTLPRLMFILVSTYLEFIHLKWMGIWIIAFVGIAFAWKKAFQKPYLTIGLFMLVYLGVTITYYQVNTFFGDISWWMNFTLNRILFALMPSVFLWMGVSLFTKKDA